MKSEARIQNEIRIALSQAGYVVFRSNVGKVKLEDGRYFDTGLPKGHSDLYGFRPDGQIFYIEVKDHRGRLRKEQVTFLDTMKKRGALTGVARSVEDALRIAKGE